MYQRLHLVRSRAGVSQTELSQDTGVSQSVISKIERGVMQNPASEKLLALADYLGVSVKEFVDDNADPDNPKSPAEIVSPSVHFPNKTDLPLIGLFDETTACSWSEKPITINKKGIGEVMTQRPPWLTGDRDAYAVRQRGDEMSPRYKPNEILYVTPDTCPTPGDDVVVHIKTEGKTLAVVRELVTIGEGTVKLRQHNPSKTQTLNSADVVEIHPICGSRRIKD